jgi:5-methylthioadenosine/S-adenosylhomocysteine deaminase
MALWPWLCELIWPYAAHLTREEAEISALLAAIEAAHAGTTGILDNHYAPSDVDSTLAVAGAIETVGLRGVVARGIFGPITDVARSRDLPPTLFRYTAEEEIALTEACIGARPAGSRVAIWPAPINPTYVDVDLTLRAVELARRSGVRWHTHCSEVRIDTEVSRSRYGMAPMEWLHREGLLGPDTTIAHAIWLSDAEIELLGSTRTGVAHNPVANGYLASGVARIRELRRAGALVALGTDGPGGGQRQDPFESMKAAVLLQRVTSLDPGALTAEDALELATREGARLLGTQAGSLSPGRLADVAVVDLTGAHVTPLHRSVSALVHSARASDVTMTVVGGEVVFEGGRCVRIDEAAVIAEAQGRAHELVERLGLQHLRAPWRASRAEGPAG